MAAAATQKYRRMSRVRRRQRKRTLYKRRRTRGKRTNRRRAKSHSRKKNVSRRNSRRMQELRFDGVRITSGAQNILHFWVHDLYKKVSLAAERLRKKKCHVSITVSDVRNALKKIMPTKYNRKSVSVICKCH